MRFVYFSHSLASCWNHGNAHFLRGILRELLAAGHQVECWEPAQSWSRQNLLADAGAHQADAWQSAYPDLVAKEYGPDADPADLARGADVVLVHEWNELPLVARLGAARRAGAPWKLLFHDTHHRAVSDPAAMRAYDLDGYDAVLAFGETLAEIYRGWGWGNRVHVWHEAADTALFHPPAQETTRQGAVWIGNWGDGERTAELEEFLLAPTKEIGLPLTIYGVRYPEEARALLSRYGVDYRGWLPNHRAPEIFAATSPHHPRPPPLLRDAAPGHPHHPRLRSPGLRHSPRLRSLARPRAPVRARRRLPHRPRRRPDAPPSRRPDARPRTPPPPRRPRPGHHPGPP